jgi:hypothetical protein
VTVSEKGRTSVPVAQLKSGYWKIQLKWSEAGKNYYEEKKITI